MRQIVVGQTGAEWPTDVAPYGDETARLRLAARVAEMICMADDNSAPDDPARRGSGVGRGLKACCARKGCLLMAEPQSTDPSPAPPVPVLAQGDPRLFSDTALGFPAKVPCIIAGCSSPAHCAAEDQPCHAMCDEHYWEGE